MCLYGSQHGGGDGSCHRVVSVSCRGNSGCCGAWVKLRSQLPQRVADAAGRRDSRGHRPGAEKWPAAAWAAGGNLVSPAGEILEGMAGDGHPEGVGMTPQPHSLFSYFFT